VIRTNYDPEADVLHVAFGPQGVRSDTSEEVAPGVFVEFARFRRLKPRPGKTASAD
jgi:hypothetical protein